MDEKIEQTRKIIELLYTKETMRILTDFSYKINSKETERLAKELSVILKQYKNEDIVPTLLLYTVEIIKKAYNWEDLILEKSKHSHQMFG